MKYRNRVLMLFFLLSNLIVFAQSNNEIREVGYFDKVQISNGIDAVLTLSDQQKVMVTVDDGQLTDVVTELKGTTLIIRLKPTRINKTKVLVDISYTIIRRIELDSQSQITSRQAITGDKLEVESNTRGMCRLMVDLQALEISGSEGSDLIFTGQCQQLDAKISTGAILRASQLTAKIADCKATLGAVAGLLVLNEATLTAYSKAEITLFGHPATLTSKTGLGGKIIENKPTVIKTSSDSLQIVK